jgi:hypothetical protein
MTTLRAILAVFRAGTGLDREQRAHLNLIRVKVLPVDALGAKQKIIERKIEKLASFLKRPVVAGSGGSHVRVLLTFPGFLVYG